MRPIAARWRLAWRFLAIALIAAIAPSSCTSGGGRAAPSDSLPKWRVSRHIGGAHRCVLAADRAWYVSASSSLQVIDPVTHEITNTITLGEPGESGPVVDMLRTDGRLIAVLDETDVIELDVSAPGAPRIISRVAADLLGVRPRRLAEAGGKLFVSGPGGVVSWSERQRVLEESGDVGRVALAGGRLVAPVGRRVITLEDRRYLGAASDLQPWPFGGPSGSLVFELRSETSSTVGLMTSEIREIDRVPIADPVRRVRVFGGRVWVVTDDAIRSYAFDGRHLIEETRIPMAGALDVAQVDRSRIIVAGARGIATAWIENNLRGPGSLVEWLTREPSHISRAWSDGRTVALTDGESTWLYSITTGRLESSSRSDFKVSDPSQTAAAVWGSARIESSGEQASVVIATSGASMTWTDKAGSRPLCLASVGGGLWIGTDRGIVMLDAAKPSSSEPAVTETGRLRIDGEVLFIFPLLAGDGAAYVTRAGGVGAISR